MRRKRGRPRVDQPRQSVCVWLKCSERDELAQMAHRSKATISGVARRIIVLALADVSDEQITSIDGLDTRRAYFGGPPPSRLHALQCSHELRARSLGIEWEPVDFWRVYEHAGGLCGICGKPVGFDVFTIDHIVPVSRSGPHIFSNLQPAHHSCNSKKYNKMPERTPAL